MSERVKELAKARYAEYRKSLKPYAEIRTMAENYIYNLEAAWKEGYESAENDMRSKINEENEKLKAELELIKSTLRPG